MTMNCSNPECEACRLHRIPISVGAYPASPVSLWIVVAILFGLALSVGALISGCGGEAPSMAQEAALPGDVTSCARTQAVNPACPGMVCSRPVEECAATGGCWFAGSGLYLYPDKSWRNPDAGQGDWSFEYLDGYEIVTLGDGTALQVDVTPGIAVPGCQ